MNFNGLRKALPVILSLVGGASTIATVIFAVKDTKKAEKAVEKKKEELNKDKLTKKEVIKATWKSYIPTGLCLIASLGCNSASTIISRKRELSLIATCTMLDQGWRKYKGKVKETLGVDTHKDIISKVMKDDIQKVDIPNIEPDKKLFYEEHIGFFISTNEGILKAQLEMNRSFALYNSDRGYYMTDGIPTLKTFLKLSDSKLLDENITIDYFENIGWCDEYLIELYGNDQWIDIEPKEDKDDNGNDVTIITFDKEPIYYPGSFDAQIYDEFKKQQLLKESNDITGADDSLDSPDYKEFIENYEDRQLENRLREK